MRVFCCNHGSRGNLEVVSVTKGSVNRLHDSKSITTEGACMCLLRKE